jgi:hypothetical protein
MITCLIEPFASAAEAAIPIMIAVRRTSWSLGVRRSMAHSGTEYEVKPMGRRWGIRWDASTGSTQGTKSTTGCHCYIVPFVKREADIRAQEFCRAGRGKSADLSPPGELKREVCFPVHEVSVTSSLRSDSSRRRFPGLVA